MDREIYNFRLYCTTEAKYIETWAQSEPHVCPNGDTHVVDPNLTVVLDTISEKTSFINGKSYSGSHGYYMLEGCGWSSLPAEIGIVQLSRTFSFPIVVYGMNVLFDAANTGDTFDVCMNPDTPIGAIIAPAAIGDQTFQVSPTVVQYAIPGFYLSLFDGANNVDLGLVTGVGSNTVTTANATTLAFAPGSYILLTVCIVKNVKVHNSENIKVGYGTMAGKPLPGGTTIQVKYNNKNGAANKNFMYNLEYTY
jgi:hypothetical protein